MILAIGLILFPFLESRFDIRKELQNFYGSAVIILNVLKAKCIKG